MNTRGSIDAIKACRILFSPDFELSLDSIFSLSSNEIKSAYRNKVFETHPDRAAMLGIDRRILEERFKDISDAFRKLSSYLEKNRDLYIYSRKKDTAKTSSVEKTPGIFLPEKELMLGQYLFHHGIISMNLLLDAVLWQRKQRPGLGEIAAKSGSITARDIEKILRGKKNGEKFGECALRLGYLNSFQLRDIVQKQKSMQRPIGEYFILNGMVSPILLNRLVKELNDHNARFRKRKLF